jgi:hypothetical protein
MAKYEPHDPQNTGWRLFLDMICIWYFVLGASIMFLGLIYLTVKRIFLGSSSAEW